MAASSTRPSTRERLEEIAREVGTLLIAFAPLDAAFAPDTALLLPTTLFFCFAGIALVGGSLYAERRRK